MNTSQLSPVSFHGNTLFITSQNGEPFTPMKPIVEGMGLNWASQTAKLNTNKSRWGVAIIATPSDGGGVQQSLCMPVRKLPAYFASINPKRVNGSIREKVIMYQNECDDALWNYWTQGIAAKPHREKPKALPPAEPACDFTRDLEIVRDCVKGVRGDVQFLVDKRMAELYRNVERIILQKNGRICLTPLNSLMRTLDRAVNAIDSGLYTMENLAYAAADIAQFAAYGKVYTY